MQLDINPAYMYTCESWDAKKKNGGKFVISIRLILFFSPIASILLCFRVVQGQIRRVRVPGDGVFWPRGTNPKNNLLVKPLACNAVRNT